MIDTFLNDLTPAQNLIEKLKAKSRKRRADQADMTRREILVGPPRNDLEPELKLIKLPLADLKVSVRKARRHSEAQYGCYHPFHYRFGLLCASSNRQGQSGTGW